MFACLVTQCHDLLTPKTWFCSAVAESAINLPALLLCIMPRVLRLLERAPRSIKLVADKEHLQVVYEDAHFLAVSKPPGLRSAPVHRFQGGSAVNRMIGYLGAEPYLLHRCGFN